MRRFSLILMLALIALALLATPAFAKKKKKKKGEVAPPPVGVVKVGKMDCYAPPDFAAMNNSNRRLARNDALQYLQQLVNGQILNGDFKIQNDENLILFETAFLGRPQLLDDWLATNFAMCSDVGKGKMKPSDYAAYLDGIGRELESGECYKPLDYEYHNFLDVQAGWQFRIHVCKGDRFLVETTTLENGKYTVADAGKPSKNVYMLADGNPLPGFGLYEKTDTLPEGVMAEPAGDRGPVPEEAWGALIMRVEAEDESNTKYIAVGLSHQFVATEHAFISFSINDNTYFDNKFHDVKGAIDYLGIDIYPPSDEDSAEGL